MANTDWNTSKDLNVTIDGVQIDDGVSGYTMPFAIRTLMADLASGASPTFSALTVTSGYVGLGTTTPGTDVGGGTMDIGQPVLEIDGVFSAAFIIDGPTPTIYLATKSGGTDDKILSFSVGSGVGKFASLNDDGTSRTDNILVMDMGSGNVGIGPASPATLLHIEDNTVAPVVTVKTTGDFTPQIVGDADRSVADSQTLAIKGNWDGTTVAVIALNTGADTVNKDDGRLLFRTASGGTLADAMTIDESGNVVITGHVKTGTTTVAGLPAAGTAGRRSFVTDANATTFASIVAGSGSNGVPVYDDGTNWSIG